MFRHTAPPFDDTGLRDLVNLFAASRPGNRLRLDSTVLSQLVQIILHLQPSLLQEELIYSLLAPPQTTDLDTFKSWRRSTSEKLISSILGSLQEGALDETLLTAVRPRCPLGCLGYTDRYLQAAHSLALFLDGDEEAKRVVYKVQDILRSAVEPQCVLSLRELTILRRSLGTIVNNHDNHVLRIAVANLIRGFMVDRFDRHLFWPHDIPAAFFNAFPLSENGGAEWLSKAVEFLSAADSSKAFRTE
ncbi:MAG: hypothetical protein AUG51_20555 [Acidobacteria bacterium 13_1_20CM_3_53_8]|nr:MAG: hypothetical protein AUG51_20555 [Acidobacteria bacterium 13_1_20CM_3_53_8]